ncbi:carboxypeptidase-like regulatory domain-containing protein [Pontibacter cellulosilyticus]|uniref:Carboxypeptidase-like regulatory domain-containing protein n=1 Tax=Pontibacter cellulosilyticus TaxID=1720253 RepID=A0A923SJI6_9BACT|nr:carboxypeptidase-like regulatory domain-containing protein [Pontibacter cellulosilyticus]MBC5993697.1 carboxypeptidase-like regulatory domain-containing protein [Pontibacter cellulosilyticus]
MLRFPLLFSFVCLMLFVSLPAQAQRKLRVSGTVVQADKKTPIPGASVIKINSSLGVVSDEQGKFVIDVAQEDTLMIRAIGFKPLLYLPKPVPVSEIRVNIVLQEDSVMLGEVEVTSRPSPEMIQRALRNMKQSTTSQAKKPGYIPGLEPPPPPEAAPATIMSPATFLYDLLSREGKEKRKLQELIILQELERLQKEREAYNKFFKDNKGYE